MEDWRTIPEFPRYSISDHGRVRNNDTGHMLKINANQRGVAIAGFMLDGVQYKRAIAVLVVDAFLRRPSDSPFQTPINLDGDRMNNRVTNLALRPRWFAIRYAKQFNYPRPRIHRPIYDKKTNEMFANSFDAATTFGLLDSDVHDSVLHRTYVWPTYQEFLVL